MNEHVIPTCTVVSTEIYSIYNVYFVLLAYINSMIEYGLNFDKGLLRGGLGGSVVVIGWLMEQESHVLTQNIF